MRLTRLWLLAAAIFCSSFANATDANSDLYWFRRILEFSNVSDSGVHQFMNPWRGAQNFRLSAEDSPWAGNYFPMKHGGVAYRWQDDSYTSEGLDKDQVLKMSEGELRKLSPVEKYDIFKRDYNFRTTSHELVTRGPLREATPEEWEGFCNGVRCAGIILPEPKFSVSVTNKDGVKVEFLPADLKALAGASYFYVEKYGQLGGPSRAGRAQNQPNAAVFDMVLRYHIAENKKPFVIDSHLGAEVWNETVVGYRRFLSRPENISKREKKAYPQAVRKVRVDVVLDTLGEVGIGDSNAQTKSLVAGGDLLTTLEASYTLYLDKKNVAIDGRWDKTNDTRGVDFAWFAEGAGTDRLNKEAGGNPFLHFKAIRYLFQESITPTCSKLFL